MNAHTTERPGWLILLYIAADDQGSGHEGILREPCNKMFEELAAAKEAGNIDQSVSVIALTDSYLDPSNAGSYPYMKPAVWKLEQSGWSETPKSQLPAELFFSGDNGSDAINTGDYRTLARFIEWGLSQYNAQHTMLSIIGHGGGWTPGLPKLDPPSDPLRVIPLDGGGHSPCLKGMCSDYRYDPKILRGLPKEEAPPFIAISTRGLALALQKGLGGRKLDVLFLDVCLSAMIEVAYEIEDHVSHMVAGEDLLYARLPYDIYLTSLNSQTNPRSLAGQIARSYNGKAGTRQESWAISAIDVEKVHDIRDKVNALAATLLEAMGANPNGDIPLRIREVYFAAQKFDYNADEKIEGNEGYIDLYDFAGRLADRFRDTEFSQRIGDAATEISAAIGASYKAQNFTNGDIVHSISGEFDDRAVIYSYAQTDITRQRMLQGAHGLSIYLPIGEWDGRDLLDPSIHALFGNDTYLSFYVSQLKFTNTSNENPDVSTGDGLTAWASLVKLLVEKFCPQPPQGHGQPPSPLRQPHLLMPTLAD